MPSLIDILKSKPQGDRLCRQLDKIKEAAIPLLAKITETFPEYTVHDIRHSEAVICILDWLVPDDLKEVFNAHEIYFLVMSAYLHDVGMVDFPELLDEGFDDFITRMRRKSLGITDEVIKREYIRQKHQLRSEQFIEKHFRELAMEDIFQAKIVGRICRGHRDADLSDRKLFNNREMYSTKNISVNVPLLSGLLQIADELDLTFARSPITVYETIKPRDPLSKLEWERHLSTCGVGLNPDNKRQIIVTAKCWNSKIYRELKRLETRLQTYLISLPEYLFQYRQFRDSLPYSVQVDIEAIGFKKLDFKFSLQEDQIVKLLMGEKLYIRKADCLRELLQNSVDACRRRSFLRENFQPYIVFRLSTDRDRLSVFDNGMGMDDYIIENYFTKIGRCFYSSPEFLEEGPTFTPASQFGIGIVSCFMLAKKIIVETKTDDFSPLKLEIDGLSDYFFVTEGKRKESGTNVILILKNGEGEKLDLIGEVRHYARHTLPIRVITPSSEVVITDKGYDLSPELLWHKYGGAPVNEHDKYLFKRFALLNILIDEKNIEGQLGLVFEKDKELGVKPVRSFYISKYSFTNKIFVSNEGIFVGDIKDLAPEWLSHGLLGKLNLHGYVLDLNAPRNDIVKNQKFVNLRRNLEKEVVSKIDETFHVFESKIEKRKELGYNFVHSYLTLHKYDPRARKTVFLDLPKRVVDIIKNSYYFECILSGSKTYRTWNDILEENGRIILASAREGEYFPWTHDYLVEIIDGCSSLSWDGYYLYKLADAGVANFLSHWDKKHGVERSPLTKKRNIFRAIRYTTIEIMNLPYFPVTWNFAKFENYDTDRMIEQFSRWGRDTFVNSEHKFIELLIKGKKVINTIAREQTVLSFLRELRKRVANSLFEKIRVEQQEILDWFRKAGMIKNIDDYLLTKRDFPPV